MASSCESQAGSGAGSRDRVTRSRDKEKGFECLRHQHVTCRHSPKVPQQLTSAHANARSRSQAPGATGNFIERPNGAATGYNRCKSRSLNALGYLKRSFPHQSTRMGGHTTQMSSHRKSNFEPDSGTKIREPDTGMVIHTRYIYLSVFCPSHVAPLPSSSRSQSESRTIGRLWLDGLDDHVGNVGLGLHGLLVDVMALDLAAELRGG